MGRRYDTIEEARHSLLRKSWLRLEDEHTDLARRGQRACKRVCDSVDTMLTPLNVTVVSGHSAPNLATIVPLGIELSHERRGGRWYYQVDRPPRHFFVALSPRDEHYEPTVRDSIAHELAHAEDFLDRQETCESDDTFIGRLEKFGGTPNHEI